MASEILTRLAAVKYSAELREFGRQGKSFEEVAGCIVRYLYETLADRETGERACALVRLFTTQRYAALEPGLQALARSAAGHTALEPDSPCLVLVATAGDRPAWNSRRTSLGHQAIPVHSEDLIARSPMILQLVRQFGIDMGAITGQDDTLLLDPAQESYGVFHVPEALGSPYVPAQAEFVVPHGIRSVVGCGAPLSAQDLFAIILFTRAPVSAEAAARFSSIALSAKLALLSYAPDALFAGA